MEGLSFLGEKLEHISVADRTMAPGDVHALALEPMDRVPDLAEGTLQM